MSVNTRGYGAPFVFAITSKGTFVEKIKDFSYRHSEEKDDEATIVIETVDANLPDKPEYQEGAKLKVVWGYITGITSQQRTVFIKDIIPTFGNNGITITIKAYDKFSKAKQNTSKNIHENKTISDLAKDIADKNNLIFRGVEGKDILVSETYGIRKPDILKTDGNFETALDNTSVPIETTFKIYDVLPQGNKSDFRLLQDLCDREPGGPYVVEGRDENLIVKKRNLRQSPIKLYTYGGGNFELISFTPEIKNRAKKSEAVNVTSTGWDPENKQYIQTESNEFTSISDKLGDLVDGSVKSFNVDKAQEPLKTQKNSSLNKDVLNPQNEKFVKDFFGLPLVNDVSEQDNPVLDSSGKDLVPPEVTGVSVLRDNNGQIVGRVLDSTSPGIFESTTYFSEAIDKTAVYKVLPHAISQYDLGINQDSIEQDPDFIKAEGDNTKSDSALDKNPGTIEAIGDPRVVSGTIVGIQGVSNKYSGNYYIKTANHHLSYDRGYLIELEVVRNAVNKTGDEDSSDLVETSRSDSKAKSSYINKSLPSEDPIIDGLRSIYTVEDIPGDDLDSKKAVLKDFFGDQIKFEGE